MPSAEQLLVWLGQDARAVVAEAALAEGKRRQWWLLKQLAE